MVCLDSESGISRSSCFGPLWKVGKVQTFSGTKKTAQRESFRAGYPTAVQGSFVRTSLVKNFGQALETLEK